MYGTVISEAKNNYFCIVLCRNSFVQADLEGAQHFLLLGVQGAAGDETLFCKIETGNCFM